MLSAPIKDTDSSLVQPDQTCQRFSLAEIQSATHNFDETLVIGRGGFGKVYKCPTKIGLAIEVAVKRLHSMSNQGADEFEAEVKLLSKLRHGNLVSLIGYCNEEKEMVVVYEFMPNGTLEDHLRKPDSSLSWLHRLKICVGAARGLDYLHTGTSTQHGVIHRDVKTSNILLDANFAAKISDFGLAKVGLIDQTQTHVSTAVKGTFGYMDPCYFYTGKLTRKSDVYAFGVVLFEVLSGRKAVDSTLDEEQWGLAVWAQDQIKEGKLNQIIDPRLNRQISKQCLKEFADIAGHCLHTKPKKRPTMAEVVVKLESILSQERESINSVVDDDGFIYKLRSFFTGKVDSAIESKSNLSALDSPMAIGSNTKQSFRIFTYAELVSATNGFKDKGYSPNFEETMYKGWVDEKTYAPTEYGVGIAMYVTEKRIRTSEKEIKPEEFKHPNLVKFVGYCLISKQKLFCVYELIPHTTLDMYLYGGEFYEKTTSISWVVRLKIAMGAAEGLFYLHKRIQPAYLQFKTSRILVDTMEILQNRKRAYIGRNSKLRVKIAKLATSRACRPYKDFNARLSDYITRPLSGYVLYPFGMDTYYASPEWFRYQADILNSTLDRLPPLDESSTSKFNSVQLDDDLAFLQYHNEEADISFDFDTNDSEHNDVDEEDDDENGFDMQYDPNDVNDNAKGDSPSKHEYFYSPSDFAVKSEIYAFGVVLLEILTGMKVYDKRRPLQKQKLLEWAIPLLADEVNLRMIMDPQLQHNHYLPDGAFELAQLVLKCLQPKPDKRPTMEEIVVVLSHCYQEEIKTV